VRYSQHKIPSFSIKFRITALVLIFVIKQSAISTVIHPISALTCGNDSRRASNSKGGSRCTLKRLELYIPELPFSLIQTTTWLNRRPGISQPRCNRPGYFGRDPRRSTTRAWEGRTLGTEVESFFYCFKEYGLIKKVALVIFTRGIFQLLFCFT